MGCILNTYCSFVMYFLLKCDIVEACNGGEVSYIKHKRRQIQMCVSCSVTVTIVFYCLHHNHDINLFSELNSPMEDKCECTLNPWNMFLNCPVSTGGEIHIFLLFFFLLANEANTFGKLCHCLCLKYSDSLKTRHGHILMDYIWWTNLMSLKC